MKRLFFLFSLMVLFCADLSSQSVYESFFTHPGLLHSAADLDRMKQNVMMNKEPWASAWKDFLKSKWLVDKYVPRPLETVGRGVGSVGQDNIQNDAAAAYYNAIAWYISGNNKYARKSVNILNAWSHKLKKINGKDAVLCSAIYGYKLANAAEILRFSYADWSGKDIDLFKTMLTNVFYPVIKDFAPFANGNWDAACITTMMSIAVFCDDRVMFDKAVNYYYYGTGNGSITNYIVNSTGQGQESGRDQPHAHLGISFLALAAETGYHQGLDMYGAHDNLLLKAFEYTSKYNLGMDVPFEAYADKTGKYNHKVISSKDRRKILTGSEMVFNHYKNRMGTEAPFTEKTARNARPETMSFDMPGAGTLLFSNFAKGEASVSSVPKPMMPAGLYTSYSNEAVTINWARSLNADSYTLWRTHVKTGEETLVARELKTTTYTDKTVKNGIIYSYKIKAQNVSGESPVSLASVICAGLPKNWETLDIGESFKNTGVQYDGQLFRIEASGADLRGNADRYRYLFTQFNGNGSVTVRFVPQVASQFVKMGVMLRETTTDNAKYASLMIMPLKGADIEMPQWYCNTVVRRTTGDSSIVAVESKPMNESFVSWGRLVNPCWLRLVRNNNIVTAFVSYDGKTWTETGKTEVLLKKKVLAGIVVCSGLMGVNTVACFDSVNIEELK